MTDNFHSTLRDRYQIHNTCEGLPINYIKLAIRPGEKRTPVNKMLNTLSQSGYQRIRDILDASTNESAGIQELDPGENNLLLDLLMRISNDPSLIVNAEALKLMEEKDIAQSGRERKIESIKRRLREMGMIE